MDVLAAGRLIAKLHCVDNNLHPRFHRHQFISSQSVFCTFFFFFFFYQPDNCRDYIADLYLSIIHTIVLLFIAIDENTLTPWKINIMLTFDERREIQVNNYSPIIKWDHPGSATPLRNFIFQSGWNWFPGIFSNFNCALHGIRYK